MASHTSNQKHRAEKRQQAGGSAAVAETSRDYGALGDIAEQGSEYLEHGMEQSQRCIKDYPGAAVGVAFVAGLGIGLAVALTIGAPHRRPQTWRQRLMAQDIGRRFLDRVEGMIPEAVAGHFNR
jgi:hypothetical protein